MTRLPGRALQVRRWGAGFFDRASCTGEKLAGIHAGHPSGYSSTHPPRHTGTPRARAVSRAAQRPALRTRTGRFFVGAHPVREHQMERNTRRWAGSFVGAHLCATNRSAAPRRRGRAQVRSYKGFRTLWRPFNLAIALCGSAPCTRQTYGAVHPAWLSRTGCAPTDRPSARRDPSARCAAKGEAQRGPALSPQRFGRVAQRFEVSPVYPRRLSHDGAPRAFGLIPARCCGRYQAIFFGLLSTRS